MKSLTIDCATCAMRGTETCHDCVVTFVCDRGPDSAVVFDAAEERALRLLGRGGLVPPLRHRRSSEGRTVPTVGADATAEGRAAV